MKKQNLIKRTIRLILIILAAAWMLFEDWVWDSLVAFMQVVGRLKIVRRLKHSSPNRINISCSRYLFSPFL
jgi:hypothetical protein